MEVRMTSNIFFNKSLFLNKPFPFDGEGYIIWKTRMRIFLEAIKFDLWGYIVNDHFIPTHLINNKVVNKPKYFWTTDKKKK